MFKTIVKAIEPVFSFVLPALCIDCQFPLDPGRKIICPDCFNNIHLLDEQWLIALKKEILPRHFDKLFVVYEFDDIFQNLIHLLKYQRAVTLAIYFARSMAAHIPDEYDALIAVPLNPIRERERGYNQSNLMAAELQRMLNISLRTDLIRRVRNTESQTKLDKKRRIQNISNAFEADSSVREKSILIIDDVITTGSTLNECAKALKEKGAARVDIAAMATPVSSSQNFMERDIEQLQVQQ
jgi:ComF family protein